MDCPRCTPYLGDYRTHSPIFPVADLEITERRDWPIEGPGGMTGFDGVARCRTCARVIDFGCTIPEGFAFTARVEKR
jgi:hypothetical protein